MSALPKFAQKRLHRCDICPRQKINDERPCLLLISAANTDKISLIWTSKLITFQSKPLERGMMSPLSSSIYTLSSVFETTDEMYDFCFTRLYSKSSSGQACLFSLKATQDSPMFTFLLNCSELYKGSLALFLNQPCYTPVDYGNYLKSVVRRSITAPNLGLSYQNPLSEVVMSSWDVSCSR